MDWTGESNMNQEQGPLLGGHAGIPHLGVGLTH